MAKGGTSNKVIITCAITGGIHTPTMSDALPYTPDDIAAQSIAAAEVSGASHKRNTLRRLARQYVRQLPQETAPPVRFDVISVYLVPGEKKEFVHFEGSFGWSERDCESR